MLPLSSPQISRARIYTDPLSGAVSANDSTAGSLGHQIVRQSEFQDNSELISSILISAAMRCGRKVRVVCKRGGTAETEVEIENPALHFCDEWYLADAKNLKTRQISISSIVKVSIV